MYICAVGNVPSDSSLQFPAPRQAGVQVSADHDCGEDNDDADQYADYADDDDGEDNDDADYAHDDDDDDGEDNDDADNVDDDDGGGDN